MLNTPMPSRSRDPTAPLVWHSTSSSPTTLYHFRVRAGLILSAYREYIVNCMPLHGVAFTAYTRELWPIHASCDCQWAKREHHYAARTLRSHSTKIAATNLLCAHQPFLSIASTQWIAMQMGHDRRGGSASEHFVHFYSLKAKFNCSFIYRFNSRSTLLFLERSRGDFIFFMGFGEITTFFLSIRYSLTTFRFGFDLFYFAYKLYDRIDGFLIANFLSRSVLLV